MKIRVSEGLKKCVYDLHGKYQDDLKCKPIVCVHRNTPDVGDRVFCLWSRGFEIVRNARFIGGSWSRGVPLTVTW